MKIKEVQACDITNPVQSWPARWPKLQAFHQIISVDLPRPWLRRSAVMVYARRRDGSETQQVAVKFWLPFFANRARRADLLADSTVRAVDALEKILPQAPEHHPV